MVPCALVSAGIGMMRSTGCSPWGNTVDMGGMAGNSNERLKAFEYYPQKSPSALRTLCLFTYHHLEEPGGALPAADAHRDHDILHAAALSFDERVPHEPRAG